MEKENIFSKIFKLDKNFILLVLLIFGFGICMLYSAAGGSVRPWATRQLLFFSLFFPIMILIAITNTNIWLKLAYPIYAMSLLLLILVDLKGHTAMGATRWIRLGGLNIQPSELMKVAMALGLARYFYPLSEDDIRKNKYLIIPGLMILIPAALIAKQPDLGTSIIIVLIGVTIFFVAGVQWWKFAICGGLMLASIPFAWRYGLRDYQKHRVMVFLNPESDPLGRGYNITQSKIAIGSGGLMGRGFLKGTQGQLTFLPEKQTDFIFTMLSEEMGFLGSGFVIVLYLGLTAYIMAIGLNSKNSFSKILVTGIGAMIFFHTVINIGMVMGLMPVVGAPLPLFSYGGTITAIALMAFGFVLNAQMYQDTTIKLRK